MSLAVSETVGRIRRFADVYEGVRERCLKYTAASKWHRVPRMTPELAKLWVQQMSLWTRSIFKMRGHVYANCPHPKLRQKLLEVVSEEDIVDPRVGMDHRQLLATSLGRASGQTLQDLESVRPLPTTLVTIDLILRDRQTNLGGGDCGRIRSRTCSS